MHSGLKFRIKEEEGLYYLCSEYKSADPLCISAPLFFALAKSRFSYDAAQCFFLIISLYLKSLSSEENHFLGFPYYFVELYIDLLKYQV